MKNNELSSDLKNKPAAPECIEGKNILLRKAKPTDGQAMFDNIWSKASIAELMFWKPIFSRSEIADKLSRTIEFQKDKAAYIVALRSTDEAIGMAGVKEEAPGVYSECGIAVAENFQHRGIGKEILGLLLWLSFEYFNASQFAYYCFETNNISKRLALSFNFYYDKTEEETREYDGKTFKTERYLLDREMYFDQKAKS